LSLIVKIVGKNLSSHYELMFQSLLKFVSNKQTLLIQKMAPIISAHFSPSIAAEIIPPA
jgi:hypothetical protein